MQHQATAEQVSDSEVEANNSEEDDESLSSLVMKSKFDHKELTMGKCKGSKKEVKVFNVCGASARLARDLNWGPVVTKDRRQAHIPEASWM